MAERLILVRHAHIAGSQPRRLVGAADAPLDATGRRQARALAESFKELSTARCYCSPLRRCRQTAQWIAPDMPITFDDDLREIAFGRWENRTFAEVAAAEPELVDRWAAFDPDFGFPGGETLRGFFDRVEGAARRLAEDEAKTVLAVTHGGVIRAIICCLLGLERRQYVLFDVDYAGVAEIRIEDGRGVLTRLSPSPASFPGVRRPRKSKGKTREGAAHG